MRTLRLTQSVVGDSRYRVDATLGGDGSPRKTSSCDFEFKITPQDREDIRWYLEDYLQYPENPAPRIAARIERRMTELGTELFSALFQANKKARDLWAAVARRLAQMRIEVVTGVRDANSLPWELLRDPVTRTPLALDSSAFVRAQTDQINFRPPTIPAVSGEPVRILLVICRPGGSEDVPFRSVANRLINGVGEAGAESFQLHVLRPPTFAQMSTVLRQAQAAGKPYHVVHFDGHGIFDDLRARFTNQAPRDFRGYLAFENSTFRGNEQLVDGATIGSLLAETNVPVLVLNACRSAHSEAPGKPTKASGDPSGNIDGDVSRGQVRAFGSLAQEVVNAGAAGVVAMGYNVYVVTAAQFIGCLYGALASGQTLGQAVTSGRRQLQENPLREIAYSPRPLQDWVVPIVYEAAPIALFLAVEPAGTMGPFSWSSGTNPMNAQSGKLDQRPVAGFFGRDETLLAIDRVFDTRQVALLHSYAGSGKTATALEFARWYHLTGGIDRPALFTSFEHKKTLLDAVNESIGVALRDELATCGIYWVSLPDKKRPEVALQLFAKFRLLWIWDNVEPIGGFPRGRPSEWDHVEQDDLVAFLHALRSTKSKILLTSRRDERDWLGDIPERISLPPMPMQERSLLARALTDNRRSGGVQASAWAPLLHFSAGNPLTLTVLVNQVVSDQLHTKEEIAKLLGHVQAGILALDAEAADTRDKSLTAALNYGFENAFSPEESRTLSLLHFFCAAVDPVILCHIGAIDREWCLEEVRGLSGETAIPLLDRCVDAGMLGRLPNACYSIHPALPWFLTNLFERYFPDKPDAENSRRYATHAFVRSMAWIAELTARHYEAGHRDEISSFMREEQNMLAAFSLARENRLFLACLQLLHALGSFYKDTGRLTSVEPLLAQITADVVNPRDDGPRVGLEKEWSGVTEYRVRLAGSSDEALRLSLLRLQFHHKQAAPYLSLPSEFLNEEQRYSIRDLAVAVEQVGNVFFQRENSECLELYGRSLSLYETAQEIQAQAVICLKIAQYFGSPKVRRFDYQQSWLLRSLHLRPESDRIGRARCLERLASLSFDDYLTATDANSPREGRFDSLNISIELFDQSLGLLSEDAILERARANFGLGRSLRELTRFTPHEPRLVRTALGHYLEAIRGFETMNDAFHAGSCRLEAAPMLANCGRIDDAREYARAALMDFEKFEGGSREWADAARSILNQIDRLEQ